MDDPRAWIAKQIQMMSSSPETVEKLSLSVTIILVLWLVNKILSKLVEKRVSDRRSRYNWQKGTSYVTTIVALLVVGRIWFQGVQSLATFFGLLSAGLAIALRDVVSDFAGWVYIIWDRPFSLGDRIEIGSARGDVIDIGVFKFTLLEVGGWVDADQSTGRMIQVPNAKIFSESVFNFNKGYDYIWNEIPVVLTMESDWKKGKKRLQELIDAYQEDQLKSIEWQFRAAEKKFMVYYQNLTPTVYTSVSDNGIVLTIRYLCKPKDRRNTRQDIWEKVLDLVEKDKNLDLAYVTVRHV